MIDGLAAALWNYAVERADATLAAEPGVLDWEWPWRPAPYDWARQGI